MTGKHIELFLVEGVPGGITTAEIAGWTGHVLAGPRSDLGDVLRRPEAKRNGAYFLLGDDEEAVGGVRCYIGRTENFINRFRDHSAKKEFWDRIVLITSKDDSFTEGHWGYLEWRLVELAKQAARVTLANGNDPQGRKLSEAQASDMEAFLAQL
ncbi:MAG: GIY-YIG nuclease family protein, partial [Actinomycetes bacterium]